MDQLRYNCPHYLIATLIIRICKFATVCHYEKVWLTVSAARVLLVTTGGIRQLYSGQ
jgi:hypothetical protein